MARPRLFKQLDAAFQGPVTLLLGPAGSGKTVLLGSWLASATPPGRVAWVSLDSADNDPARFWAYFLAALRQSGAAPPEGPVGGLGLPIGGPDRRFMLKLTSALAKLEEPVVVILDDLHEITNPAVLDGLAAILRQPPAALRLMLATRDDGPLPLAPLRVDGRLTEVGAADLAFTTDEAGELLAGHGLILPDTGLAVLQACTEGWAAGLRLAALSLQGHPDPQDFLAQFAGSSRAVADYLLAEVLGRMPEDLRTFLLHTSVVERLSGGLADALTGRAGGAQILAELERINAFVVLLDREQSWYRYHQLLIDLLRDQLQAGAPRLVPELHRRAASWYREHGFPVEAARHALAAGHWSQAAELVARVWRDLLLDGEMTMLGDLMDQFPPSVIRADAELLAVRAARRLGVGDRDGADADLRLAEQVAADLPQRRRARFGITMATVSLYRARIRGDLDAAVLAGREMLAPWGSGLEDLVGDDDMRALALLNLGIAEVWTGAAGSIGHLKEGLAAARRAGRDCLVVDFLGHLAAMTAGSRLREGVKLAREALRLAERRGWSQNPSAACAYTVLAGAHHDWGNLAVADWYLERAAACQPEPAISLTIDLTRAVVSHARGDAAAGLELLRAAQLDLQRLHGPHVLAVSLLEWEARLLATTGQTKQAQALLTPAGDGRRPSMATLAARAELQLAEGDAAGALATLRPCLDGSASPLLIYQTLETLLLDAIARRRLGDHDGAAESVERALRIAEPEGYRQVFWTLGGEVRTLLTRHRHRGTAHPRLLADLLARPASAPPAAAPLVEPLTDREQTVLRYLSGNLSRRQIADELYVSVNTVSSHVRSVYRKLNASHRDDAVRQGRQLRLL